MAHIADYALIGDGRTAALVSNHASIDWLCWPRFDSDACLAALVGRAENGRWSLAPLEALAHSSRRYDGDTLVLHTDMETASGAVRVIDFMPAGRSDSRIIRIVEGLSGVVAMQSALRLMFDFGSVPPWTEIERAEARMAIGPDLVLLRGAVALEWEGGELIATFDVAAGERVCFELAYGASLAPAPERVDAEDALQSTLAFWRDWIARFNKFTPWPEAVRRSLLTLKALIQADTGGLVAAATTSIPERAGGSDNWDYRYCWLRDSSFTLNALLNAGLHEEAQAWRDWLLRAVGGAPDKMRIAYRLDGSRNMPERTLDWLDGYHWARPVRVGNAAATQHQVDVFGELINAFHLAARAGLPDTPQSLALQKALVGQIEALWRTPGKGLWESRKEAKHYVYSRVMAWVGLDRFLNGPATRINLEEGALDRLKALRSRIHEEVCAHGFHEGLGSFVAYLGGREIDASVLLLPLVGFLPIDDARVASTIDTIERELMRDGLVFRHKPQSDSPEGAFLACSCWLADCRAMQGRHEDARKIFECVLSLRNDVGLMSEEYDVHRSAAMRQLSPSAEPSGARDHRLYRCRDRCCNTAAVSASQLAAPRESADTVGRAQRDRLDRQRGVDATDCRKHRAVADPKVWDIPRAAVSRR